MQSVPIPSSQTNMISRQDYEASLAATSYHCTYDAMLNNNHYQNSYDSYYTNHLHPLDQEPSYFTNNLNNSYPTNDNQIMSFPPTIEHTTPTNYAPPQIEYITSPIDEGNVFNLSIDANTSQSTISAVNQLSYPVSPTSVTSQFTTHSNDNINTDFHKLHPANITPAFHTNNNYKPMPLGPFNSHTQFQCNNNSIPLPLSMPIPLSSIDTQINVNKNKRNKKYKPQTHTNTSQKYACNMCTKTFKHPQNLKIHHIVHTDRALVCNYCQKRFARNSNLKQHLRVHTGEKPFECEYCKRRFKQKHSLIDHIRLHTGETPYRCHICFAKFHVKSALKTHQKVHK